MQTTIIKDLILDKKTPPKKLIALRIEPYLIDYIDKLAAKELRSRSQIIRMILSQHKVTNGS